MTLTLLRHAHVQEQFQGKYNGHIDISLSKYGKLEAQKLKEAFQNANFDKIYCSDLKRARETLEMLELQNETIFTKKLREKSWGIHEGKSFHEIESMGIKYESFEQWIHALDGEDPDIYREKTKEYFYNVIAKENAKNILIVTHGGLIKTLLSIVKNVTLEEAFSKQINYASFIQLEITPSK